MDLYRVTQSFADQRIADISSEVDAQLQHIIRSQKTAGKRIGITVGSRGVDQIDVITKACVTTLKAAGAQPFIIPAMGSHGGGTPEGQLHILETYGVTEATMGAPILASMETDKIGAIDDVDIWWSRAALEADGVLLLGRIKPHTGFVSLKAESGIAKMCAIGLGKQRGAEALHSQEKRLGMEQCILAPLNRALELGKVWGALAVVEDAFHHTAIARAMLPDEIHSGEAELLAQAKAMMPSLPFKEIDALFIRWMGKNISGSGIDSNIVALRADGTFRFRDLPRKGQTQIGVVMVTDLTPETGGNAVGIGIADLATKRLVDSIDREKTELNARTSYAMESADLPPICENDRTMLERAAQMTGRSLEELRLVCIEHTLNLSKFYCSKSLCAEAAQANNCEVSSAPTPLFFDRNDMIDLSFR